MSGNRRRDERAGIDVADGWCILRTRPASTLTLARALNEHGLEAWTPMTTSMYRLPRKRERVERQAPIIPTFVFVRARHVPELAQSLLRPSSPYPAFSIFRYYGKTPKLSDGQIASLRAAEERAAAAFAKEKKKCTRAPTFGIGQSVRVMQDAFAGMTGVVVGSRDKKGKVLAVNLGAGWVVSIDAWLLDSADVDETHKPAMGAAA